MAKPAVFFDRDGVLIHDDGFVHQPEQVRWVEGATDAVRAANDAGYLVFVVTNQSGVARGYFSEGDVQHLHQWMSAELSNAGARIDEFAYCPFFEGGTVQEYAKPSPHRKPNPGMLIALSQKWDVDMARSFLVGDKDTDIQAAEAAGIPGYLFRSGSLAAFIQRHLDPVT